MARLDHLNFLEKKNKLYPLKKRKIYQEAVDTVTLAEREKMKRLILSGKTDWSPPMSESKEGEDFESSSIDSGRDSKLEAKLNASTSVVPPNKIAQKAFNGGQQENQDQA